MNGLQISANILEVNVNLLAINYYTFIIQTAISLRFRQPVCECDRKCKENGTKLPTYLSRKLAVWSSKTTRESRTLTAFDTDE